jgi:hypothetical protein
MNKVVIVLTASLLVVGAAVWSEKVDPSKADAADNRMESNRMPSIQVMQARVQMKELPVLDVVEPY